ncbi:phosphate ABC transporter substrate-binding protein [Pseudoalteromonas mariniglutinosa]|uniref:phosphate ABC transporter substrate-binding protein n=1 Tax=Pseudoalteromonas mariniglutinosa TaxID=206042 RepID=UPI00384C4FED
MKKLLIATALTMCTSTVFADIAVIVNPANNNSVDENTIKKIYLGKSKSFGDGSKVNPVNQDGNAVSNEFNDKVVGKSGSQLNAYWSKLVFTGKGTPPEKLANDQAVIDFVASNTDAIGYIDSAKVTDTVKVVGTF